MGKVKFSTTTPPAINYYRCHHVFFIRFPPPPGERDLGENLLVFEVRKEDKRQKRKFRGKKKCAGRAAGR